jgi:hypothetical protein
VQSGLGCSGSGVRGTPAGTRSLGRWSRLGYVWRTARNAALRAAQGLLQQRDRSRKPGVCTAGARLRGDSSKAYRYVFYCHALMGAIPLHAYHGVGVCGVKQGLIVGCFNNCTAEHYLVRFRLGCTKQIAARNGPMHRM